MVIEVVVIVLIVCGGGGGFSPHPTTTIVRPNNHNIKFLRILIVIVVISTSNYIFAGNIIVKLRTYYYQLSPAHVFIMQFIMFIDIACLLHPRTTLKFSFSMLSSNMIVHIIL